MQYIKRFENFTNDENRGDEQTYPEFNQANRLKAKEYVDIIFNKGSGAEVNDVCKEIECDLPKEDSELDEIKEKAIEYFIKNPERMKSFGNDQFKTFNVNAGDGVVRTNNIGGVRESNEGNPQGLKKGDNITFEFKGQIVGGEIKNIVGLNAEISSKYLKSNTSLPLRQLKKENKLISESTKPGPTVEDSIKIDITKDEMKLFSSEASLMKLMKRNKISLYNNQVWYKKDDKEAVQILDIFFNTEDEIENEIDNNEED